jgi:predicted GNAT family acetyltransferase
MKENIENTEVVNNEKAHQFEIKLNDKMAFIPYNVKEDMIELFHTEVPDEFSGQGFGTKLALCALNYAKDHRLQIILYCPFIIKYIKEHPEWKPYVKRFSIRANH